IYGLARDVYANTIRLFKFITALVDMPKDCEKYRLQLIMEYNRVLAWGKAAGLVDIQEGETLSSTLGTNPTELIAIVARIQWLLAEFRDLNGRYGNELKPDDGAGGDPEKRPIATDADVLRQVSNLAVSYESTTKERRAKRGLKQIRSFFDKAIQNTKEIATQPARVRWVVMDKDIFVALLADLHVLTERLHELMRDYRESKIDEITAKTYREMIITRNGVQDLRDMFDAVTGLVATSSTTGKGTITSSNNDKTLQDLVRLKRISRTSEVILSRVTVAKHTAKFDLQKTIADLGTTVPRYTQDLWDAHVWLNQDNDSDDPEQPCRRPRGVLSTPKGDIPIWIEYKSFGSYVPGSLKDKESALRTVALAEMLHLPKPTSLYIPQCLGYFDDREIGKTERYGWIFKMARGSDHDTQVRSLYDILGHRSLKPSLSQRLTMARRLCSTVLNLHAANWLHKGIFSDNVIFHFGGGGRPGHQYDPTIPCLTGFEFSRPEGSDTTSREEDLAWDLYRWPGIQREAPLERNSRKTYDLYSLGLVLLEIAHWEPLWKILGLSARTSHQKRPAIIPYVSLSDSKQVRNWLLGIRDANTTSEAPFKRQGRSNPVKELKNIMGDRYFSVVARCLWAHGEQGFGVDDEDHAGRGGNSRLELVEDGIKLQDAFTRLVVEELEGIVI
ncbi:Prion-inhibition and propagation domain containing protein, partial [Naviculisporaceae sp. PSN 640]